MIIRRRNYSYHLKPMKIDQQPLLDLKSSFQKYLQVSDKNKKLNATFF